MNIYGDTLLLVLNLKNLYLQGFISSQNIYYYFTDSDFRRITGVTANNSLNIGGNYSGSSNLDASNDIQLSWGSFHNAVVSLASYRGGVVGPLEKSNLVRVIFLSSESFRFKNIRDVVISTFSFSEELEDWGVYKPTLNNWSLYSDYALHDVADPEAQRTLKIVKTKL